MQRVNARQVLRASALVALFSLGTASTSGAAASCAKRCPDGCADHDALDPRDDASALYQRVRVSDAADAPRVLAIDLAPAAWRVGSADGPPADAAQLRAAFGALTGFDIEHPCAQAQEEAQEEAQASAGAAHCVSALPPPAYAGIEWHAGSRRIVLGWTAINPLPAGAAPDGSRYFGLLAPERYLADAAAAYRYAIALRYAPAQALQVGAGIATLVMHTRATAPPGAAERGFARAAARVIVPAETP